MAKASASQGDLTNKKIGSTPTGAGLYACNARDIVMGETCRAMVVERGRQDWDSEFQHFPRMFQGHECIPCPTRPTTTFNHRVTVYLDKRRADLMHLGRADTAGDIDTPRIRAAARATFRCGPNCRGKS